ncbi:MAG TPA: helix-hairpin-helix domain-containing protein, partial [Geminicoccaceae bacterium]|nr:helix-hairpin-helix domain-containing protein [Geminicoccaceae bacterium]
MAQARSAEKVNLNRASQDELVEAGLRAASAEAVIKRREQQGRFRSVDELTEVPGIGEATLHELRPRLTVEEGGNGSERRQEREGEQRQEREQAEQRQEREQAERRQERERERAAAEFQRRGRETAQQASEVARQGSEQLLAMSRSVAESSGTLLQDGTELGDAWLTLWREQMSESTTMLRELSQCYDWRRMLELQLRFMQTSMDRTMQRMTRSAELCNRMLQHAAQPVEEGQQRTR